jgi:hypothetical protein
VSGGGALFHFDDLAFEFVACAQPHGIRLSLLSGVVRP